MMHKLAQVRRAAREAQLRQEGRPMLRPILTGSARNGYTPGDLEGLESVAIKAQTDGGGFVFLEGYDNIDDFL